MTFDKLNDNIILVELSSEEMREYKITYENLNNDNKDSQSAIRNLLDSVDKRKRIEKGEKVIVEALPIENGGCFFIFTFTPSVKKKYKIKKSEGTTFFYMGNMNNLLDFINVAKKTFENETSVTVYKMNEEFFISTNGNHDLNNLLSEFGEIVENFNRNRILEYGENQGRIYLQ
jgi:negative regulator of genetic competence, sporulation and motility